MANIHKTGEEWDVPEPEPVSIPAPEESPYQERPGEEPAYLPENEPSKIEPERVSP